MKIYAFEYCSCCYESTFETVSLHFKKADAYKKLRERKLSDYEDLLEMLRVCGKDPGWKVPDWILYRIRTRVIE